MLQKLINSALAAPSGERLKTIASGAEYNVEKSFEPAMLIANIIIYVLGFAGLIFLVMVLYSGAKMIFAGGNEQEIEASKTRLKNSVLGFIIIILAFSILLFIRGAILNVV